MSERAERVEQSSAERVDAGVDRVDPDPVEEPQPDLHRREVEVVDRAVLEVRGARGGLVVLALNERGDDRPAENHGRSSLASVSRRASRQPIPVGQPNIL